MSNNRISSVNNSGVVSSLIEHTHIQTEYVCNVNCTSHTAFIRADNHHVVGIDLQVGLGAQQVFDELIRSLNGFETV